MMADVHISMCSFHWPSSHIGTPHDMATHANAVITTPISTSISNTTTTTAHTGPPSLVVLAPLFSWAPEGVVL